MAKCCTRSGFAATTIGDIVEQASISRATFYKHFANKRECFDAAVESFIEELEAAAVGAQSGTASRPIAIRRALGKVLELLAAKPEFASLTLLEAPVVEPGIIVRHRERAVKALESQWVAGKGGRQAGADSRIAFGRAHVLVASYLAAGRGPQLQELLPELTYTALLPFVGHEKALGQVKFAL
jgi:AcrR family transcriptional regulator